MDCGWTKRGEKAREGGFNLMPVSDKTSLIRRDEQSAEKNYLKEKKKKKKSPDT